MGIGHVDGLLQELDLKVNSCVPCPLVVESWSSSGVVPGGSCGT